MWLLELVKHATENKDIGSWDISLKMKEMNETFNERYTDSFGWRLFPIYFHLKLHKNTNNANFWSLKKIDK